MTPEVYSLILPLYKEPDETFRDFVSSYATDPSFLMQVLSNRASVLFIPADKAKILSVSTEVFMRDSSSSKDFEAISRFCTQFNMIAAFVPNANAATKSNFLLELDENRGLYDDAVQVLIASFRVTNPAAIITIDNLFKLLD